MVNRNTGAKRVIIGSANMSARAWDNSQREFRGYCDNGKYYEDMLLEFEFNKLNRANIVEKNVDLIQLDESGLVPIEKLPVSKEVKVKDVDVIFNHCPESVSEIKFAINTTKIADNIKKYLPEPVKENGVVVITPKHIREIERKSKEEIIKTEIIKNPTITYDIDNKKAFFDYKEIDLEVSKEQVKKSLEYILKYFDGFKNFNGNIEKNRENYYRVFIHSLLSSFTSIARSLFNETGNTYESYPYLIFLCGTSNAGKSAFVDMLQKMLIGQKLDRLPANDYWTPPKMRDLIYGNKGILIHLDELNKTKFATNADPILKMDNFLLQNDIKEHPVFIITSNTIDKKHINPSYIKRVAYYNIDLSIDIEKGDKMKKYVKEWFSYIDNNFHKEFIKRMLDKYFDMKKKIEEFGTEYDPDLYIMTTQIILDIIEYCGIEKPEYIKPLSLQEFRYKENNVEIGIKEELYCDLQHNFKEMFVVNKKKNELSILYNDNAWDAQRMATQLSKINAQKSGKKVIISLDAFEKYMKGHFEYSLFIPNKAIGFKKDEE